MNIDFPEEIFFIKTTANEEGGARGYTRGNYVVLREDVLSHSNDILNHLVTHELLHILTRANNNFRKEMYEIIGFKLIEPIDYPESLKAFRITNPDATQTDSYIQLEVQGESVECMMILYSK